MQLNDSFEVAAPVEDAWRLLNDVPAIVPCIPGAKLTETLGGDAWRALVHVTLGPIGLQFDTEVTRTEVDEQSHRVLLSTKA